MSPRREHVPSTIPARGSAGPDWSGARQRLLGARGVSASSPLVDAQQAAQLLGVPHTWLLAQARERRIPHHRLGHYVRFDIDELIAWLDQTRIAPR